MEISTLNVIPRLPRFRRAPEPPSFRLTDDDVEIVRQIGRHRFLRSTHIASLVARSLDRTNDRLLFLYHAGYIDRPRAQLDRFPTDGSSHLVYALADRGARLLQKRDGKHFPTIELSRHNRQAGRPFIEHQLEIADFHVALRCAAGTRPDISVTDPEQMVTRPTYRAWKNPFALRVKVRHRGGVHEIGLVPDFVFSLCSGSGMQRNFMVEIDRGTMPVSRSDFAQTSVEKKMRAYLAAYVARMHERHFGWNSFRVLVVTTDERRTRNMIETLRGIHIPGNMGPSLFFFATREQLRGCNPLTFPWADGIGKSQTLVA